MTKKILAALGLVISLLTSFVVGAALESLGTTYPIGTTMFASVDFSSSNSAKNEVITAIESMFCGHQSFGVLTKADSMSSNDTKLYYFGNRQQVLNNLKANQYSKSQSMRLIPLSDLDDLSISGAYSFSDANMMESFEKVVKQYGGSIVNSGQRTSSVDVIGLLSSNRSGGFGIILLCIVMCATCWSWAGGRERLHSILVLNGCRSGVILCRDIGDFLRIWGFPCVFGMAVSIALTLWSHSVGSVSEYLKSYCVAEISIVLLFVSVAVAFSMLTMPSVRQLSMRRNLSKRLLFGQVGLKFLCVVLAMVAGVSSLSMSELAAQQRRSAERWKGAEQVVSVNTFTDPATSSRETVRAFQDFFTLADKENGLYLSYSVAPALTEGIAPTKSDMLRQIQPYDDVVITNTPFLTLMKTSKNDLKKIQSSDIPSSLLKELRTYDHIWINDQSKVTLEDCLYEWRGDDLFSSLEFNAQSGLFSMSHNPLIIVVDNASNVFKLDGFLYPAFSSANILFRDGAFVDKISKESGLSSFNSVSRVANDAFYQYRILKQDSELNLFYMVVVLLEVLLCMTQNASLWAYENRRTLFIQHTIGRSYSRIACLHLILQMILLLCSFGITCIIAKQQQCLDRTTLLFMVAICCACMVIEFATNLIASNKCFKDVVCRSVR